jgi:hypothetical protein
MVTGVSAGGAAGFAAAARDVALALQRLCAGDLRGIFDGPTSEGIDLEGALFVLDLSAMRDSDALAVLMTCTAARQQAILGERKEAADREGVPMAKGFCVFEEVWRVASNVGVAEWLQSNFKLCRALGIANFVSLHKLTDFGTAGSEDSRAARIAQALVADAGCIVIYRQSPDQRPILRADLGCSDTETELATRLEIGEAIWKIGSRSMLVRQRMFAAGALDHPHRRADGRHRRRRDVVNEDGDRLIWIALGGLALGLASLRSGRPVPSRRCSWAAVGTLCRSPNCPPPRHGSSPTWATRRPPGPPAAGGRCRVPSHSGSARFSSPPR